MLAEPRSRFSQTADATIGGEEVMQVFIRQAKYDQLAHKLDKLGDFKPDFVFEQASGSRKSIRATTRLSARSMPHATSALW